MMCESNVTVGAGLVIVSPFIDGCVENPPGDHPEETDVVPFDAIGVVWRSRLCGDRGCVAIGGGLRSVDWDTMGC
jgi:hypothetical protein